MNNDRFWQLVSRHLAGEASVEEEAELQDFIEQLPEYKKRYEVLVSYWGKSKQREALDVDNAYLKIREQISSDSHSGAPKVQRKIFFLNYTWAARIAATLLIATGIGLYLYYSTPARTYLVRLAWDVKQNSKGERSKITLADGTTVWLNAESTLKYPEEFSPGSREVYLSGEAFFNVAKNPQKPFIIHLNNGKVRVLGTSFNVKAFDNDNIIETSVVTGKVAFIPEKFKADISPDTVLLLPNHKAVYSKQLKTVNTERTNSVDDKAWVDGRMIFKSETFEQIARELERNYGKQVVFSSENLKSCRFTATFQNNTLEEVMMLLSQTNDYQYEIKEDKLIINGTGCTGK
jgi:transmembrane sensor